MHHDEPDEQTLRSLGAKGWTGTAESEGAAPIIPDAAQTEEDSSDPAPSAQQGITVAQTFARLLKFEEIVRNLIPSQKQRSDRIEQRIDGLEEALQSQIADLETGYKSAATSTETRLTDQVAVVQSAIESAEAARAVAEKRAEVAAARAADALARHDAYRQAWQAAPLGLRLNFVRDLLPEAHASRNVLKEAAALEDLRRRGQDLETWLANYPSLFADAMQSLDPGAAPESRADDVEGLNPVEFLAAQTVEDARAALETTLQALGVAWIAPSPGDAVLSEHEVIGEEPSPYGDGRVARMRRRGFRVRGRLAIPAQVTRTVDISAPASGSRQAVDRSPVDAAAEKTASGSASSEPAWWLTAEPAQSDPSPGVEAAPQSSSDVEGVSRGISSDTQTAASGTITDLETASLRIPANAEAIASGTSTDNKSGAGEVPDWMRMLGQRMFGCDLPVVSDFARRILALSDLPGRITATSESEAQNLLTETMTPLLPLLGLRYSGGLSGIPEAWGAIFLDVRDPLIEWLNGTLNLFTLVPVRGARFDTSTMEAIETRRTVHAAENETVARFERVGLMWRERPLLRAQVVRYAAEGTL